MKMVVNTCRGVPSPSGLAQFCCSCEIRFGTPPQISLVPCGCQLCTPAAQGTPSVSPATSPCPASTRGAQSHGPPVLTPRHAKWLQEHAGCPNAESPRELLMPCSSVNAWAASCSVLRPSTPLPALPCAAGCGPGCRAALRGRGVLGPNDGCQ